MVIFDNVRVTFGKSRDLIGINLVHWEGLFAIRENRRAFLEKVYKEWGFFLENRED